MIPPSSSTAGYTENNVGAGYTWVQWYPIRHSKILVAALLSVLDLPFQRPFPC
jgi:hypothetical protein